MAERPDRGLSGVDAMMWRTGRAGPAMRWLITAVIGLGRSPGWDGFLEPGAASPRTEEWLMALGGPLPETDPSTTPLGFSEPATGGVGPTVLVAGESGSSDTER